MCNIRYIVILIKYVSSLYTNSVQVEDGPVPPYHIILYYNIYYYNTVSTFSLISRPDVFSPFFPVGDVSLVVVICRIRNAILSATTATTVEIDNINNDGIILYSIISCHSPQILCRDVSILCGILEISFGYYMIIIIIIINIRRHRRMLCCSTV